MAAGFRSPLPILGLGAEGTRAGVRSMLAPWLGGAGVAGIAPETSGGYRSLLAFWAGGAGVAHEDGSGGGRPRAVPHSRPLEMPARRRPNRREQADETTVREALDAFDALVGTQTPAAQRTRPVEADSGPRGTSAQMLRAELAQIQTQAREREAKFAAERERMSAQAEAAEAAALLAARKRDNNRRAQILIALLMLLS
jgi:hypothetical protein